MTPDDLDSDTINQMLIGTIPIKCPELTENNRVQRNSVDELHNYMKLYGMFNGFTVYRRSERGGLAGFFYCCYGDSKKSNSSYQRMQGWACWMHHSALQWKSSENTDQLQRAAVLHLIMHEPAQFVTNIRQQTVSCTCGAVTRMLLPCRHIIAVNKAVFNQRFNEEQVVNRWRRDYMINPSTKQPEKVKVQVWQPHELQGQMRIHSSNAQEDENASLEEKVDSLLNRARAVAVKSLSMFSQLSTLVQPWIKQTMVANPQWTDLVQDPPSKYGRNTSKKRVRSTGEDDRSAKTTRPATQQEVQLFLSKRADSCEFLQR